MHDQFNNAQNCSTTRKAQNYSPMFKIDSHFKLTFNKGTKLFCSEQNTFKYIKSSFCDMKFEVYKL